MPRWSLPFLAAVLALASVSPPLSAEPRVDRAPSTLVYPDFWHTPLGIHRASPQLLKLLVGDQAHFDDPAGVACARMQEDGEQNPQITAFGINRGSGQVVFNPDMKSLAVYGASGSGDDQFLHPEGVACRPDGTVAVADTGNHRVVLLRYHQGQLHWDHALGEHGRANGQFIRPRAVAFDSQDRLYVADSGNNRVQVFDADGRFQSTFGGDPNANNSMMEPTALAVVDPAEPYTAEPDGAVYLVDQNHQRLQKFSLTGRFLGQATAQDLNHPTAVFDSVALDYFDNAWVTDRANGMIHKVDKHLQWIDSWGKPGTDDGNLDSPRGVAINRHYGQVLVLEQASAQYFWIGADVKDVRFSQEEDPEAGIHQRIDYRLTERAWVDVWIEDRDHQRQVTLQTHKLQKQGAQTLLWTGDIDTGYRIPSGSYYIVFQAEATYSSATYVKRELRKKFSVK